MNNDRRSDVHIQKNICKAQEKRKQDLDLLPPGNNVCAAEKHAFQAILLTDVQHVSWLLKQPAGADVDLYHKTASLYKTASDMLIKARAVDHLDAWLNAGSFLSSWRQHGTPFYSQEPAAPSRKLPWMHVKNTAANNVLFQYTWNMCDCYEGQLASAIIKYRWTMALLGRVYANKIAQLEDNDRVAGSDNSRNRYDEGKIRTVSSDTPSKKQRLASRW